MKYKILKIKKCPEPGLNQRPPDLQSDALPTELSRQYIFNSLLYNKLELLLITYYNNK